MGGLVSGLFDLFSGDPTSGQRKKLDDLSGFENNLGEKSVGQGLGWESDILSGDQAKIAQAIAPEIRAGQDMVQQQAEQNARFGNRGGGTNASTQNAQSNERGNIISLIGDLQGKAASTLTGAGEDLLGQGSTNISKSADLAERNRQRQVGDVGGIASSVASIAAPFLAPAAAATQTAGDVVGTLNPEFAATRVGPEPGAFDWSGVNTLPEDIFTAH